MNTSIFENVHVNWFEQDFKPAFDNAIVTEYLVASSPYATEKEWLLMIERQIIGALQSCKKTEPPSYKQLIAAYQFVDSHVRKLTSERLVD